MKIDRLFCVLLTFAAIVIAGCGGGGGDTSSTNPSASAYSISGTVTFNGAGVPGVTVTLSAPGGTSPATVTDANGNYLFTGLTDGQYTLTPSSNGSTFTPTSLTVAISGANSTGNNFTSAAGLPAGHRISGVITELSPTGPGIPAVSVTLGGASLASSPTVTTDASGNYAFSGLADGTYTVTPGATGYLFSSPSLTVTISAADSTGNNFSVSNVYSLSGGVTSTLPPVGPVQGIKMLVSGSSSTFIPATTAISDASGNYTFVGLLNGTYTVTPGRDRIFDAANNLVTLFTFTPQSRQATISDANTTGIDFVTTMTTTSAYSVSGNIVAGTATFGSIVLQGVTVVLSDSNFVVIATTTTDANGHYTFVGVPNGNYIVNPAHFDTGHCPSPILHSFVPASANITVNGADATVSDFTENTSRDGCSIPL